MRRVRIRERRVKDIQSRMLVRNMRLIRAQLKYRGKRVFNEEGA